MLCSIYRSQKHQNTYLYVERRGDFSRVPSELMAQLSPLHFVMLLSLNKRKKLVNADIVRVKDDLQAAGYYLQLPPPIPIINF